MPEIVIAPNPSLTPVHVSTPRSSSGTVTSSNASSTPNALNTPNTTPNVPNTAKAADSTADAGTAPDSFAQVLQRQLAQSSSTEPTEPAKPVVTLPLDLALLLTPDAALLPGLALLLTPDAALLPGLTLLPVALQPESGADAKSKSLADQEVPDAEPGISPLSSYLFAITQNTPVKLDAGLPATGKKLDAASTGEALLATTASLTLVPTGLSSAKDAAQNTPQAPLETASKTAEFAALLASSAEAVSARAPRNEAAAGSETGFENLLAAQVASQNRGVEMHPANHVTTALPVQTPVGARGWDGEVSDKLVWMVGRQQQRAELVLNPPQLGRVEVSLSMQGDQTNAVFVSANPAVRDALEAALPRLREMLADAGINLGQAQVGADTANNAANQSANNRENRDNLGRNSGVDGVATSGDMLLPVGAPQWIKQSNGMVDVFA